jgi:hypothetical protein
MMKQDPAAFREMVAAGVRLLTGNKVASEEKTGARPDAGIEEGSLAPAANGAAYARDDGKSAQPLRSDGPFAQSTQGKQAGMAVPQDVDGRTAEAYASFEKAANAELERSVGVKIEATLEQALPNLRRGGSGSDGAALTQRLGNAVRDEVDAALKSDAQLGEQIARVLAGRRFESGAREQVVRLIDARAQQLVPGAVRRVVSGWTETALASRRGDGPSRRTPTGKTAGGAAGRGAEGEVRSEPRQSTRRAGRVDYGKLSDQEILDL